MFSSAAPISADTGPITAAAITSRIKRHSIDPAQVVTPAQLESYFERHSAIYMAGHNDLEELESVRWLIDCGDGDFLTVGNAQVHISSPNVKFSANTGFAMEATTGPIGATPSPSSSNWSPIHSTSTNRRED